MIGARARDLRIARSLRQSDLAKAVGVTIATIGRFEQTGKVGFEIVVGIAIALGAEAEFARLFTRPQPRSIDEIIAAKTRRSRVRRR
jgi:transcriptional regulator with XRE-family HTH domain